MYHIYIFMINLSFISVSQAKKVIGSRASGVPESFNKSVSSTLIKVEFRNGSKDM